MLRVLVLVLLAVGCASPSSGPPVSCPALAKTGDACGQPEGEGCLITNTFSTCLSEWCACEAGAFRCEVLAPQDGQACDASALASCTYEGNPTCDQAPTAEACTCESGTWECVCECYASAGTCGQCPASYSPLLDGKGCEVDCTVEGHSCTCADTNGTGKRFSCN